MIVTFETTLGAEVADGRLTFRHKIETRETLSADFQVLRTAYFAAGSALEKEMAEVDQA